MKLIDDDGFLTITVVRGESEHSLRLDALGAFNTFLDLSEKHKDGTSAEHYAEVAAYLAGLGLPDVSTLTVERVMVAVFERVEQLRKKPAPADSPTPA